MANWDNLRTSQEELNVDVAGDEMPVPPAALVVDANGGIDLSDLAALIKNVVKEETSKIFRKMDQMAKRLDVLNTKVDTLAVQQKQILDKMAKGRTPANQLLTHDGMKKMRLAAWKTLPHLVGDAEAVAASRNLILDLRLAGDMLDNSAKAEMDVIKALNDERNDLKSHVKRKIANDLSALGGTPEGHKVEGAKAYLAYHLKGDLTEDILVVLYQMVYMYAKFLNKKVVHLSDEEMQQRTNILEDFWRSVSVRIERNKLDSSQLIERTRQYLHRGFEEVKAGGKRKAS